MSEETRIDKDYKDAFNLGYELAQDLKLKSPMFKDISSDNYRMNAMQAGMEQYSKEIVVQKSKEKENTFGLNKSSGIPKEHKDKGKGFDLFI